MLIFGFHSVTSRLRQSPVSVRELYVDARRDYGRARDLLALAAKLGVDARRVEVSRLDHVRTARAKGASETRVVLVHILRAGLLPVVSFLGPAFANTVGTMPVASTSTVLEHLPFM
jgi:uracil phosphoribosyltransferase